MSTSEYEAFIRRDVVNQVTGNRPMDAGFARVVVNNALHLADECGQVLVNSVGRTSKGLSGQTTTSTAWARIASFGPFPVRVRPDGQPYKYRIRVAANNGGGVFSTRIRVGVGAQDTLRAQISATTPPPNVAEWTVATSSTFWLVPHQLVEIPASTVPGLIYAFPTRDTSGDARAVQLPRVFVEVWTINDTTPGGNATVVGLNVAEVIGL